MVGQPAGDAVAGEHDARRAHVLREEDRVRHADRQLEHIARPLDVPEVDDTFDAVLGFTAK